MRTTSKKWKIEEVVAAFVRAHLNRDESRLAVGALTGRDEAA